MALCFVAALHHLLPVHMMPIRRPPSVTVAGFLLLAESVLLIVKGLWAANMDHEAQLSSFLVPVLIAPIVAAIVGKLVLSGFRIARYAYWLVVAGGIWMLTQGEGNAKSWGVVAVDLYFGVLLFMPRANAFFAGRDYIRQPHAAPVVVEEQPVEETKYTASPRIAPRSSPRGSGPASPTS